MNLPQNYSGSAVDLIWSLEYDKDRFHSRFLRDLPSTPQRKICDPLATSLRLFQLALVLVPFDHVVSFIVNADHNIM
jgi:hypothetical protein